MASVQRFLAILLGGFLILAAFAYANPNVDTGMMRGEITDHVLCPLMGTTPTCMGVLQHLAHWQATFTATLIGIAPILLTLIFSGAFFWLTRKYIWELFDISIRTSFIRAGSPALLLRHVLQEAFASGIIHSKAY